MGQEGGYVLVKWCSQPFKIDYNNLITPNALNFQCFRVVFSSQDRYFTSSNQLLPTLTTRLECTHHKLHFLEHVVIFLKTAGVRP